MAKKNKPNFESINYNLRPAKGVERKMLCEAFSRLSVLDNIKNYRYIGFGSTYFTDFNLFHKNLGIKDLLSIEKEKAYAARVKFNIPYSCIEVEYGPSTTVLPSLPWHKWKQKCIVWLDYTQPLLEFMLGDINTVVSSVEPGSVFLISVNISPDKTGKSNNDTDEEFDDETVKKIRYQKLVERVGDAAPAEASDLNLNVANNKKVIRKIIDSQIKSAVRTRNIDKEGAERLLYSQVFNIFYRDGADMLTIGGILYDSNQTEKVKAMNLHDLDFISDGENTFDIVVPNLSIREMHALDALLPSKHDDAFKLPLSKEDVNNYANIYRYFPTFAEAQL